MHEIEPYYNWGKYYSAASDPKSPFYGRTYGNEYVNDVYGYYIHPFWDEIGSSTLYVKLLFVEYKQRFAIIELFGEWNDTLHNDSMYLKREVVDVLVRRGINQFILIGENIFQFHGGDTDYYEEWFEDVGDGWIAAINFRDFILQEFDRYHIDSYINYGGTLQFDNWRTAKPQQLYEVVKALIIRRLA